MAELFNHYKFNGNSEVHQFINSIIPLLKQITEDLSKKSSKCYSLSTAYLATVLEDVRVTDELKDENKTKLMMFIDTCTFSLKYPFIDAPIENFLTADASGLPALFIHLCIVLGEIQLLITYLLETNYKTINYTSGSILQQFFVLLGNVIKKLKNHSINVPKLLQSNDSQDNVIVVSCLAKCMQGIQDKVMKAHMTITLTCQRLQQGKAVSDDNTREDQISQLIQVLQNSNEVMQYLDSTVFLMQKPINDSNQIHKLVNNGIALIEKLQITIGKQLQ